MQISEVPLAFRESPKKLAIKLESWRALLLGSPLVVRLKGTAPGLFHQALNGLDILNFAGLYSGGQYQPRLRNAVYLVKLHPPIYPESALYMFATCAQYSVEETRAYLLGLARVGLFGKNS